MSVLVVSFSFILGSYDKDDGAQLYMVDPSGISYVSLLSHLYMVGTQVGESSSNNTVCVFVCLCAGLLGMCHRKGKTSCKD